MSDAYAERVKEDVGVPVEGAPEGRSITLSATLHPNGQIEFVVPKNKIVAHGLVGAVQAHLAMLETMQKASEMQQTSGKGISGLMKKMGRG